MKSFRFYRVNLIGLFLALMFILSSGLISCSSQKSYNHSILATGEPGINQYPDRPPGQSTILPRAYVGAPPFIPHSLKGLVISQDNISCFMCHLTGMSLSVGHVATKIPESHYSDLSSGIKSTGIQGMRYNCFTCHISQSSEKAPVD